MHLEQDQEDDIFIIGIIGDLGLRGGAGVGVESQRG